MLESGVAVEGTDSGQAGVAGADAVSSLAFEVLEERCDCGSVEVFEAELGRRCAAAVVDEATRTLKVSRYAATVLGLA